MSKCAWVTLTTNDAYSLGAMVLAHSLKRVGTVHDLVVMVTPTVSEAMRSRLREAFNLVQEVNVMDSKDAANLAILARPELGITFTKLHAWTLVQYEKCVFLDSDTLVIQNCDELMEREELSAAPDVCWPDCFNSGVFVYRPNQATFTSIIEFAAKNGSFDGGDQGILNSYFSQWAHTDITKHLPYTYNTAAFAVYSYLPAFKEFKNKIKILHFAGKVKPWLLNFNSETKQASIPPMFTHAGEFIQLWWNIFCDTVHQRLSDQMKKDCIHQMQTYWPIEEFHNIPTWTQNNNNPNLPSSPSVSNYDSGNFFDDIQPYHDPWEDYYEHLEKLNEQNFNNHNETFNEHKSSSQSPPPPSQICSMGQQHHHQHDINSNSNYVQTQSEPENRVESVSHHDSSESYHTSPHNGESSEIQQNWPQGNNKQQEIVEHHVFHDAHSQWCQTVPTNNDSNTHRTLSENELNQSLNEALLEEEHNHIESNLDSSAITVSSESSSESSDDYQDLPPVATQIYSNRNRIENEAGLAGALAQVRLGEPRSSEQEAYEASMRRQCWEVGNIDYTGRDSFDNIWKKIQETLETKPEKSAKPADGQLTSDQIKDGKIEYDPVTKAKTVYKHIEGGYEVHITTPQQNGTVKTQVKTFYDPKPVTEEEALKQQQEKKKRVKKAPGQVVQIDKNTTMITREIPGGYEEVYTTVYDDGSRSMQTKTFYDAVEQEIVDESNTKVQQKKKPSSKLTRNDTEEEERNVKKSLNKQLVESNQRNVRQVDQDSNEEYNAKHESTVEETRRVSKKTETSNKKTIVRKESVQEENTKNSTTSSKDKKKKSKKAPPPPADFPQNETTTVTSSKVSGGNEYTYSTVLEDGKTITTSKTIYEEEDLEMTEEEIQIYKKHLKDAEKHKNVTTTKKLKSQSGTKKIVPSDNPGEVTTVETIQIEGGTEYHYTTVTAEGIVKKAVKTVYDPVPKENPDDSEEEEIIEDYEEEIIEPGEKIFKTIESVKTLPQRFDEIVEVNTPKKKSTKLSRTDTQEEESRIVEKNKNAMTAINQQQSNVRKVEQEEHTTGRYNVRRESKVEETRSMTQKIKISGNY